MSFELRPLSMGELLDRTFSVYRRRPALFIGIMAAPTVFALGLGLVVTVMTATQPGFNGRPFDPNQSPPLALFVGLAIGYLAFTVLYGTAYILALAASMTAVSDLYLGRQTTIRDAYAQLTGRVGRVLLLGVLLLLRIMAIGIGLVAVTAALAAILSFVPALSAIVLVVGMVAAFVVIAVVSLRYALAVPALVNEQSRAGDAIRRSIALTKGHRGRIFLLFVCATVLTYAALAIFQAPFTLGANLAGAGTTTAFWLTMAGVVSGTLGGMLTAPVMIIGIAVLYFDVRVRKEALDVQMMMLALDAGDPAAPAPAAPAFPTRPGA
jgi:MFS family permease